MSMRSAIISHLSADAAVLAIVTSTAGPKIFPQVAPTSAAPPYITISKVSSFHARHLTAAEGVANPRYQIDSWATTSDAADALFETVREAMDHSYGEMGQNQHTETVQGAFLEGEFDGFETPRGANQVDIFRVISEWSFWHTETVPVHT